MKREGVFMKQKRNLNAVVMWIIVTLFSFYLQSENVQASDAGTRQAAVNWTYAQEGKSLDYDGKWGAQCVDLIKYYYAYFGKASYATGNGYKYASNPLPDGWTRIKNTADFIPEPGDIAVWGTELSKDGHVAIILSANKSTFVSMDQNWPRGSACKQVTHTYNKFWGVIRPNFKSTAPITVSPSIWKNTDRYTVGEKSHIWNSGEITTEATCTENGIRTYTCMVCKASKTEDIPATGHQHIEILNEKEENCTEEGYTGDIYCADCKTIISVGETLSKTNHSWDEGKITTPAACTTAGVKTYTCTFCGITKTEDIPATGHVTKVKKFTKDATCKTEGYSGDVYCQDCGALLEEGKVLPKVEHSWDEGQITTPATCMAEGVKTFTCTVCEETKSEKIPAVGHGATEVRNRKDATCAAEGYTGDTHCTVCGEVISKGEITTMTAHSWDAGKITKQPTTTKTGTKTFTCQTCGLTRTETVAKLKVKKLTPGKIVKSKATNGVYKVLKDGRSVEFTKPIAKRTSVKIANTIKINGITCKVTGISASAFKNNTFLRTVIIGKNVTSIGSNAFYGCKKLTRITGGSAVTKIGDKAFYNCSSLTSITIPAGVNKIGKMAFYNCKKLRTIVVKTSKLTSRNIGSKAFAGTYAKAAIKVPVKQLNTYKKLFKSKGMGPKAVYKK